MKPLSSVQNVKLLDGTNHQERRNNFFSHLESRLGNNEGVSTRFINLNSLILIYFGVKECMAKKRKRAIKRSGKINHSLKKSSFRKGFLVVVISLVAVFLLAVGYQSNKNKLEQSNNQGDLATEGVGSFAPSTESFGGVDIINCNAEKIACLKACNPPNDQTCVDECENEFFLCIDLTVGDTNYYRCPIDMPTPCPELSAVTLPKICCKINERCEYILVDLNVPIYHCVLI